MLPNVAGDAATKPQILLYSLVLVAVDARCPRFIGFGGLALRRRSPPSPALVFLLAAPVRLLPHRARRRRMTQAGRSPVHLFAELPVRRSSSP